LITSDGCLSSDGRHIDITSSDYEFLCNLKEILALTNKITIKYGCKHKKSFHIQIGNINLYEFLLSVGLTPNKSLTIKKVEVSRKHFVDFLRGVIDGDGGIQHWIHASNHHEQWNLRISSGSMQFLTWLQKEVENMVGVSGKIYRQGLRVYRLKYGKMAAKAIVKQCYYSECTGLQRKIDLARQCITSYNGWSKSKTVSSIAS